MATKAMLRKMNKSRVDNVWHAQVHAERADLHEDKRALEKLPRDGCMSKRTVM